MNSQLQQFNKLKQRSGKNVEITRADFTKIKTVAIIKEFDNGNNSTDDKTIFFSVKDNIIQGDIVKYENNTYIILLQEENINNVYCRYVMRRSDNKIKIYVNNKLEEIPCNVETFQQGIEEGKYMITGDGNLKLTTQDNNVTNKIKESMRIIKWGYAWKVISKTAENKGLRYIFFEKDLINNSTDDLENEIADYHNNIHTYKLEINTTPITLNINETLQLDIKAYDNDVIVENPQINYSILNADILQIENNTIKPLKIGVTKLNIQFKNITKEIEINIVDVINSNNYDMLIDGGNYIKWGRQAEYNITLKLNNVTYNDACDFYLTDINNNSTTLATIISKENNKCVIEANTNKKSGIILLHCKTDKIHETKEIEIKSLWV